MKRKDWTNELILRCKANHTPTADRERAWQELMETSGWVAVHRRISHSFGIPHTEIQDLQQEIAVGFMEAVELYRPVESGTNENEKRFYGLALLICQRTIITKIVAATNRKRKPELPMISLPEVSDWQYLQQKSDRDEPCIKDDVKKMLLYKLTPNETAILRKFCEGKSYQMIADEIGTSEKYVDNHIQKIKRKAQTVTQQYANDIVE